MDPKRFNAVVVDWFKSVVDVEGDVISVDGKILRRAFTKAGKRPCIVSAHSHRTKLVIGQVKADEKSNEITAIPELLDLLYLKGAIVTIDATGCQRKIVKKIVRRGALYLISLKGNLEARFARSVLVFSSQRPTTSEDWTLNAGCWLLRHFGRRPPTCCGLTGQYSAESARSERNSRGTKTSCSACCWRHSGQDRTKGSPIELARARCPSIGKEIGRGRFEAP